MVVKEAKFLQGLLSHVVVVGLRAVPSLSVLPS